MTASDYHNGWTYQGGAFEQWFDQSWTSGLAQDTLAHQIERMPNAPEDVNVLPLTAHPIFNENPAGLSNASASTITRYFLDWLAHPSYDDYWRRWSIEEHCSDIRVPALHTAAWYDICLGGSLRNYIGLKARAATEGARKGQRLLIVIGGHAGDGRKIGEVDFDPEAEKFSEDVVTLDWCEFLFKRSRNEFATGKAVKIFVMGIDQWRDEDDWPLARAQSTKYFLHSQGRANTARGNGSLSTRAPGAEPSDEFVYDPAKPVPTVGGPLCCDGAHLAPGPRDQRSVEERDDVLVYSTSPLDHDIEVTGPVRLEFLPHLLPWTLTSPLNSSTLHRMAGPLTSLRASFVLATGIPNPHLLSSFAGKLICSQSTFGPRAMSSTPGTASGSNSPAATSRASTATSTLAS